MIQRPSRGALSIEAQLLIATSAAALVRDMADEKRSPSQNRSVTLKTHQVANGMVLLRDIGLA
ncbi:hypothetical protein [Methylobacterium sp. Leaf118]|uniref:hypothetical protein n=1 Tax=Methylobacterium sp. Leaf118 TaxID=2876562 RepID=UPI001E456686|nr:hypothetical protein [Methylobacterium sp. Leaf118]